MREGKKRNTDSADRGCGLSAPPELFALFFHRPVEYIHLVEAL
jgi:hypothetical protein